MEQREAVERLRFRGDLLASLVRRDVLGRYRGSLFGVLWSLLAPLLMLVVYTIAFHELLGARWPGADGRAGFASMVFTGLLLHGLLAEVLVKAPQSVAGQPNFVKKMVFPLTVLPMVPLGAALVHALLGFLVLAIASLVGQGQAVHLTGLLLPLLMVPFLVMLAGLSWMLAAVGVYVRDIAQLGGVVATILLFLSPIFFPLSTLPERYQGIVAINPLTWMVESARGLLFAGELPDPATTAAYCLIAGVAAALGLLSFRRLRPGFGDVL
jgi:lipopolysaccharide transport system permease protein